MAWGLASSQSDGGLPPPHRTCRQIFVPRLRRTARRNFILAPTCGSAALALTPSPPRGMEGGGRGAPPAPPVPAVGVGSWAEGRDGERGHSGIAPDASGGHWHKAASGRRVCPWASSGQHPGLCRGVGQRVTCQELGKWGENPAGHRPCHHPRPRSPWPGSAAVVSRRGAVPRAWGAGFAHGCLLAIRKCEKKQGGRGQGAPSARGGGVPRCLAPPSPAVLLSLAPGPAGP